MIFDKVISTINSKRQMGNSNLNNRKNSECDIKYLRYVLTENKGMRRLVSGIVNLNKSC